MAPCALPWLIPSQSELDPKPPAGEIVGMKQRQHRTTAPASPAPAAGSLQGTLAFYGPNDGIATKAVGVIFRLPQREVVARELWYSASNDLRAEQATAVKIAQFFKQHGAIHVTVGEGITGCPHEEGADYPLGESCPLCPFWKKSRI